MDTHLDTSLGPNMGASVGANMGASLSTSLGASPHPQAILSLQASPGPDAYPASALSRVSLGLSHRRRDSGYLDPLASVRFDNPYNIVPPSIIYILTI